jgi:hypothetical protein
MSRMTICSSAIGEPLSQEIDRFAGAKYLGTSEV